MRELTFKPKINNNSKSIDRRINSTVSRDERFHKLHRIAGDKQARLNKIRNEKENELNEDEIECLFHPELISKYKREFISDMRFVDRSNLWKKRRDSKVQRQQENKIVSEVHGCTFAPKILPEKKQSFLSNVPKKSYGSVTNRQRSGLTNGYQSKQILRSNHNQLNQVFEYNEIESEANNDFCPKARRCNLPC